MRNLMNLCIMAVASMSLLACGGSSSNGTGTPPTGVTSPPPPPTANEQFPNLFSANFPENGGFAHFETPSFKFHAPNSDLPGNLVLIGADAQYFSLNITATAANSNGDRDITVTVNTSTRFNFENPFDANSDNLYEFTLQGDYLGDSITSAVKVRITDLDDAAEAVGGVIIGETNAQYFGAPLRLIPDISGDGNPELSAAIQSGEGPASAYVLSSEFLNASKTGKTKITPATNVGTRFLEAVIDEGSKYNYISGQTRETDGGTDLLLSEAEKDRLVLFKVTTINEQMALEGDIAPDNISEKIVYSFAANSNVEGRLIDDVNGDDINDIFVRFVDKSNLSKKYGIIFGKEATSQADRLRTGKFDIEFNYLAKSLGGNVSKFIVEVVPDIDGDGKEDLLMSAPAIDGFHSNSGVVWVIRSALLQAATVTPIDLEAMTAVQGRAIPNTGAFGIVQTSDYDGDGIPTFLFDSNRGIFVIDGDNLIASGEPNVLINGTVISGSIDVGDIDGDGVNDLINSSRDSGRVLSGSIIKDALEQNENVRITSGMLFQIDLDNLLTYADSINGAPIHLAEQGLIAFPFVTTDRTVSGVENNGRIVLVKISDISNSIMNGDVNLEIRQE